MPITLILRNDDGEEEEHIFPSRKEVCSDCQGEGFVLNESMRNHAYTAEEFYEEFDEEGREHYFRRGGMYDVQCPTCKGKNVIDVVDEEEVQRQPALAACYQQWEKQEEEDARWEAMDRAIQRSERLAGC